MIPHVKHKILCSDILPRIFTKVAALSSLASHNLLKTKQISRILRNIRLVQRNAGSYCLDDQWWTSPALLLFFITSVLITMRGLMRRLTDCR